jgi:glutamyl-tRNA synthetase
VSHNPAAFDIEKLRWMNGHYIQRMPPGELAGALFELLTREGLAPDTETLLAAVPLVNERMKVLSEGVEMLRFLFVDELTPNDKAQKLIEKAGVEHLRAATEALRPVEPWTAEEITSALTAFQGTVELSRTKAWQPVRAAVTGSDVSPPLPESLALLGRERTLERLESAVRSLGG